MLRYLILVMSLFITSMANAQTITIHSPVQDTVVQGTININATLSDPAAVSKVTFHWLEGDCRSIPSWGGCLIRSRGEIGEVLQAPFSIDFDTNILDNDKTYFIAVCTFNGAEETGCEQVWGLLPDNPDTTGPALRYGNFQIFSPYFVPWNGTVILNTFATDDSDIAYVEFYYDNYNFIGRVTESEPTNPGLFRLEWDSTQVNNGEHDIIIIAEDTLGNRTELTPFRLGWGRYIVENRYAPNNVVGRAKDYHVNVVWEGSGQEQTFSVFRRLDSETEFSQIGQTVENVWVDDMPVGTAYAEYYIVALYDYGESEPSATVSVTPTFRSR